jgi:hypothetical protein
MKLSYPPIRIHIWGGLGSQLFAWALLFDLKKRYPHRRFIVVFHNGGVTLRAPELNEYIQDCGIEVVNDFQINESNQTLALLSVRIGRICTFSMRLLGRSLGFIADANTDENFNRVKPWVVSLRGHYSRRRVTNETSNFIFSCLFSKIKDQDIELPKIPTIHIRLGDLEYLRTKSPLSIERVINGLRESCVDQTIPNRFQIFSDSPDLAMSRLNSSIPEIDFTSSDLLPRETIYCLAESVLFVGAPSKISEWVTVFRHYMGKGSSTWLPMEMKNQIETVLGNTLTIRFY